MISDKVHKQLINNYPLFRPILSAIDTPTYNIAKFFVLIRKPLTTNHYTLKDTSELLRDILNQNANLFMTGLDADLFFSNIFLNEPNKIIIEKLFSDNENNFNKNQFKYFLTLATKEPYFMTTCHPKNKFPFEKEQNKCFNFLDVKVFRENNVCTTSVDRKLPVRGVYAHCDSYMSLNWKFSLVSTFIFRSFTRCCDMPNFLQDICKIKYIFIKNGCNEGFIDKCVKTFLNKVFIPKRMI